ILASLYKAPCNFKVLTSGIKAYCSSSEFNSVFIDRRYIYDNGSLKLSARSNKDALITNVQEAKYQYENFLKEKIQIDGKFYTLKADTACIHSDAPNALEMAKLLCSR
ncbi:LamB/YcsF family protein, partial [Sulfurimonas sp. MAG313]